MSYKIIDLLREHGPQLASALKEKLMSDGLSDQAARQQISRAKGTICRLNTVALPKNESFLYLENQYSTSQYWTALLKALLQKNSAYGIALQGLIAKGGILPEPYFGIVSGCPFRAVKKQLNTSFIIGKLIEMKLLERVIVEPHGPCLQVAAYGRLITPDPNRMTSQLVVEDILIKAVKEWLRKLGFTSYNMTGIRSLSFQPNFGPFQWDVAGPSYLYPMVIKGKNRVKPGSVVADIFIGQELNEDDIRYFLKKCRMARSQEKLAPFMAILIADHFTAEALALGKKEGLMLATPGNLFGTHISDGLRALLDTLNNAAAIAVANPEKVGKLFSSLGAIEGAAINLRGALFNLLAGNILHADIDGSIDIGVKVHIPGVVPKSAEIDVRNVRAHGTEVTILECKGQRVPVTKDDVETWLTKKVPIIHKALNSESRFKDSIFTFEFWAASGFEEDALDYLNHQKRTIKKFVLGFKSGDDILKLARKRKLSSIVEMLNEHYLKHPLALDAKEEDKRLQAKPIKLLETSKFPLVRIDNC